MTSLRADAERNRRLILEAAAEAFAERGLDAGMAEVGDRPGRFARSERREDGEAERAADLL